MKKICIWLLGLVLLSGCGQGLPQSREMDDMALMRTMGVDEGEEGSFVVTVSSARRARGLQGEGEKPLILSAQQSSISGACLDIQGQSDSYVFFGHVDQLLLGETLARGIGVMESLEYFSREESLGLGTQVWLIRNGSARQAIRGKEDQGADDRLSTLQQTGRLGITGGVRTVGECLSDLLERGCGYVPALEWDGEASVLREGGYGVLKDGVLIGWLTGEEGEGLDLARGQPGNFMLELENGSVRVNRTVLTCIPVVENGVLAGLQLELRLNARVEELRGSSDQEQMEQMVSQLAKERLSSLIIRMQEWNADCIGLKEMAGAARPEVWKTIREKWDERFPKLEIGIRCTAALNGVDK